ncbi:MAG: hypothetical protein R3C97_00060 [Geminicoccaceae bacterium]
MTKPYVRLDRNDAAMLMVDHQTGLLSLVRDIDPDRFKNNVLAVADLAAYFKLPTILTTSFYAMHAKRGQHFGNGRSVRGYFEDVLKRQARRLSETPTKGRGTLSRDALSAIEAADVPSPQS